MLFRARTVASARAMLSAGIVGSALSTAISISSAFDAGNIKVVSTSATKAVLEIKPDPLTELEQKAPLTLTLTLARTRALALALTLTLTFMLTLSPRPHPHAQAHLQWFYFRATASEPG